MNRQIFQGDVIEQLAKFPDSSIDVVISSPPYYSLRNYLVEGQLGLEPDFHDYLNKMQTIMDELKRVLKNTGTCWINLGDTYSTETQTAKSRIGIPERFYINCIDGGWIARNHIIWTKNNCMPSSVKDRFTNKWESVFFFSKNKKYYFDLDAVREPTITGTKPFNARVRDSKKQRYLQKATDEEIKNHNVKGEFKGKASKEFLLKWQKNEDSIHGNNAYNPKGKNPGDVFQINIRPFKEAHFATFPPDLPQKILRCACPKDGIVLDPFFGAGTVGLVAEQMGLQWCGIELNPEYIEIAKKRLGPYTAIQKMEAFV